MKFQETLDQVALTGSLFQKGWLAGDLLRAYSSAYSRNLLENMKKILNCPFPSEKSKEMKVVSLQLSDLIGDSQSEDIQNLCSSRRTFVTKGLWRILVPQGSHRFSIETLREKAVANLRNEVEISEQAKNILSELYFLLTLGSVELLDLFQHPFEHGNQSNIKKCLTSLKKMMGNQVQMEDEDKRIKKKAYSQNLEIRKVLEALSTHIVEEGLQKKVQKMLKAPKNKKWFGNRLNKLMIEDNWSSEEMKIFASYLEDLCNEKQIDGVKLNKSRNTLKQIHANIVKYFDLEPQNREQCVVDESETKKQETNHPIRKNTEEIIQISQEPLGGIRKGWSLFECLLQQQSNDLN